MMSTTVEAPFCDAMKGHPQRLAAVQAGALALTFLALTGCGAQDSDTTSEPHRDTSSSVSPDASRSPESGQNEAGTAGDAFGVDQADWPGNLGGAKALFDRMPPRMAGAVRLRPRFFGSAAGVTYGRGGSAPTAWVMEAGSDVPDAPSALAVMFGMSMACKKDSYQGTAPQSRFGGGPDLDQSGDYDPGAEPWWFACTIDGVEGDPGFTGYALGWASGDLGWLTTAADRSTSRELVEALFEAAE